MNNRNFLMHRRIALHYVWPFAMATTALILISMAWLNIGMDLQDKMVTVPISVLFLAGVSFLTMRTIFGKFLQRLKNKTLLGVRRALKRSSTRGYSGPKSTIRAALKEYPALPSATVPFALMAAVLFGTSVGTTLGNSWMGWTLGIASGISVFAFFWGLAILATVMVYQTYGPRRVDKKDEDRS